MQQNYNKTTIVNSINDPKRLWYNVKNIINLKSKRKIVPQKILSSDNRTLHEPIEIANEFNTYFSEIGSKLAEKI